MVTPPHAFSRWMNSRLPAFARGRRSLGANGLRVRQKLFRDLGFFGRPRRAHLCFAEFRDQRFVAAQEFLHLHDVVGQRFGRRVDRRQAAADHDDRHADLQVGERIEFRRAGQLQRHQEIRRLANAAHQTVLHRDHGGPAGAGAERDVIEAQFEGAVDGQRAAEAHAAVHAELAPPLDQQPDHLQEVLVPAHRDAVFGDAAETGHHALVETLVDFGDVVNGPERDAIARARRRPRYPAAAARSSGHRRRRPCGRRSSDDAPA